jgi:hypothetical protein
MNYPETYKARWTWVNESSKRRLFCEARAQETLYNPRLDTDEPGVRLRVCVYHYTGLVKSGPKSLEELKIANTR